MYPVLVVIKKIIFSNKSQKCLSLLLCLFLYQCQTNKNVNKSKAIIELGSAKIEIKKLKENNFELKEEIDQFNDKGKILNLNKLNKKNFPILSSLPTINIDDGDIEVEQKTDEVFRTNDNEFIFTFNFPIKTKKKITIDNHELKLIKGLVGRHIVYLGIYKGKQIIIKKYHPDIYLDFVFVEKELQRHKKINELDKDTDCELDKMSPKLLNILKDQSGNIYVMMEYVEENIEECCSNFYKWIKSMYEKLIKLHSNNIYHTDFDLSNFKGYKLIDFEKHKKENGHFFFSGNNKSTLAVKDISGLARCLLYKYISLYSIETIKDIRDITIKYKEALGKVDKEHKDKKEDKKIKERDKRKRDKREIKEENAFIDNIKKVLDKNNVSTKHTNFLIKVSKGKITTAEKVLKELEKNNSKK